MNKIILMAIISTTFIACEQYDRVKSVPPPAEQDYDNTGINTRDRDSRTKTPFDQSGNEADRAITQKIRQAIMSDDFLSTNAKNIKIITIDGVVTLRGPVSSAKEKEAIAAKVNEIQGITKVDNQLEVTVNN